MKTSSVVISVVCIVFVLIFLVPMLLLGGSQMFDNLSYSENKESKLAEEYLTKKYGESFTVNTDTVLYRQTLGTSTMKAYPNDSPNTIFSIDVYHKKSRVYHENYVLNRSFTPILKSALTKDSYYYDVYYEEEDYYSEVYEIPYVKKVNWQDHLPDYVNEALEFNLFTYWQVENKQRSENVDKLHNIESLIQLLHKNQVYKGTINLFYPTAVTDEAQTRDYNEMIEVRKSEKENYTPVIRDKIERCSLPLEDINKNVTIADFVVEKCSDLREIAF